MVFPSEYFVSCRPNFLSWVVLEEYSQHLGDVCGAPIVLVPEKCFPEKLSCGASRIDAEAEMVLEGT